MSSSSWSRGLFLLSLLLGGESAPPLLLSLEERDRAGGGEGDLSSLELGLGDLLVCRGCSCLTRGGGVWDLLSLDPDFVFADLSGVFDLAPLLGGGVRLFDLLSLDLDLSGVFDLSLLLGEGDLRLSLLLCRGDSGLFSLVGDPSDLRSFLCLSGLSERSLPLLERSLELFSELLLLLLLSLSSSPSLSFLPELSLRVLLVLGDGDLLSSRLRFLLLSLELAPSSSSASLPSFLRPPRSSWPLLFLLLRSSSSSSWLFSLLLGLSFLDLFGLGEPRLRSVPF